MSSVSVTAAKKNFSKLLRRVAAGEEIVISNRGIPVALLVPVSPRPLGLDKNHVRIAKDFDAPLPPDIMEGFLGKPVKPKVRSMRAGVREFFLIRIAHDRNLSRACVNMSRVYLRARKGSDMQAGGRGKIAVYDSCRKTRPRIRLFSNRECGIKIQRNRKRMSQIEISNREWMGDSEIPK
jgi:prevent-host-death family protein